jgi:F-type H+-transporting ATPase subunit a
MEAASVVFPLGGLAITSTVVTTWGLMLVLGLGCWLATRHLSVDRPGLVQTALEGVVQAIQAAIEDVLPGRSDLLLPFVGTLWLFVAAANLTGLVPEMHSPTGDLSTTAALAFLVFLSVHWFGIRSSGLRNYLRHYLTPSPVLLPFHVLGEFSRTIALAMRLFGNIMSLEMAALLVLLVAGLLVPVPILMLHIVEALVQAYIFGTLTLIYIAGGMQSQETSGNPEEPLSNTSDKKEGRMP